MKTNLKNSLYIVIAISSLLSPIAHAGKCFDFKKEYKIKPETAPVQVVQAGELKEHVKHSKFDHVKTVVALVGTGALLAVSQSDVVKNVGAAVGFSQKETTAAIGLCGGLWTGSIAGMKRLDYYSKWAPVLVGSYGFAHSPLVKKLVSYVNVANIDQLPSSKFGLTALTVVTYVAAKTTLQKYCPIFADSLDGKKFVDLKVGDEVKRYYR